ncbi:hypothetical protein [Dyadobacter frigoris]|uniref:Uncharacterized protein n=1 Tax=Dyadobacter frigoris TaxID=2576211 RepID=A0A4V6BJ57_9BACT|nr:hypothetical protein [Dyadobacter frigoris]TKT90713.1 hypothetical protein FDK13_17235 [Dyadobacter frigoris]
MPGSELNGDKEASLQISYSSSASGNFLVTSGSIPVPSDNSEPLTIAIRKITATSFRPELTSLNN